MDSVKQHFPELSPDALAALEAYSRTLLSWNERVNLISRKDTDNFIEHHLLHALTISKFIQFPKGGKILDVGTGGGLPGLVLAILFPDARFTLVDSVGKKVNVLESIASELGLANVLLIHDRVENLREKYDWVTGRAVTSLPVFISWVRGRVRSTRPGDRPRGVIYLKGTLYREECQGMGVEPSVIKPLDSWIPTDYYADKFLLFFEQRTLLRAKVPKKER